MSNFKFNVGDIVVDKHSKYGTVIHVSRQKLVVKKEVSTSEHINKPSLDLNKLEYKLVTPHNLLLKLIQRIDQG